MCQKIDSPQPAQPADSKPFTRQEQAMIDYAFKIANAEIICLLEDIFEGAVRGVPLDRWPDHVAAVIRGAMRDHPDPLKFLTELQQELLDLIKPRIPALPNDLDD